MFAFTTGQVLLEKNEFGIISFKHGKGERVFLLDDDKLWISCNNSDGFVLENCIWTNDAVSFIDLEGCLSPQIKEQLIDGSRTFRFNMLTKEKHFTDDPSYPNCREGSNWNTNNILNHILSWKMSLYKSQSYKIN